MFQKKILKLLNMILTQQAHKHLSGLTRATNAPFRGITPPLTSAFAHTAGVKFMVRLT